MTTRRTLFVAAPGVVASLASVKSVLAQGAQEPAKQADFLFVQTAKRMTFDKSASKLTLTGVSPIMVMFSDRPERIAANMRTAEFVPFWSKGKDSFLSDPPNADISILEGDRLRLADRGREPHVPRRAGLGFELVEHRAPLLGREGPRRRRRNGRGRRRGGEGSGPLRRRGTATCDHERGDRYGNEAREHRPHLPRGREPCQRRQR